jgi:hypothetical protein
MKLYTTFKAVYKIIDIELVPIRNNKISIPLSKKNIFGSKLHKLPMQLKMKIIPKRNKPKTAIKKIESHAILFLVSLII